MLKVFRWKRLTMKHGSTNSKIFLHLPNFGKIATPIENPQRIIPHVHLPINGINALSWCCETRKHDAGFPYQCFTPKGNLVKHPYRLISIQPELCHFYIPFFVLVVPFPPLNLSRSPVEPTGGFFVEFLGVLLYCILDIWNQQILGCFHQPGCGCQVFVVDVFTGCTVVMVNHQKCTNIPFWENVWSFTCSLRIKQANPSWMAWYF